jgi:superfamily I DNA/RNA helicase
MEWMEDNLDAYRTIAEILHELRQIMRREIENAHGKEWYRTALPDGMFDRLVDRKEHEKEIDWYENEYRELVEFASFKDLLDILERNPSLIPGLENLAPSTMMLHTRFVELEVMREKLAMCRPISEKELTFLSTFHLRFRQALETARTQLSKISRNAQPPAAKNEAAPAASPSDAQASPDQPKPEPTAKPAAQPEEKAEPKPDPEPKTEAAEPADDEGEQKKDDAPKRPPMRRAVTSQKAKSGRGGAKEGGAKADAEDTEDETPLDVALKENDHQTVLRALYREVTAIAEGLWTSDIPPTANVWSQVRVSPWYEAQISKLGLKPLSDFYGVIDKVDDRMQDGIAKDQLQEFLKGSNFAQILLALRDMFQKNNI